MTEDVLDCRDVEVLAAELALGVVSAGERASALAHLGHCRGCQRLVDELATVADDLLLLAPEAEPTIGFESRVLAATGAPMERRPDRKPGRSRLRTAVAAAALVVVGGAGLIAGLTAAPQPEVRNEVRTALDVSASGRATCRAFAFGDPQAWIFVSLEAPREWTADYEVEVVTAGGGPPAPVGHLRLQGGQATLGVTVDAPARSLRAIRVLDTSGELRYEAAFDTA
ncbi:MAG: hypothetical protein LC733_04620 [Actinobacteria bacterium]|nr:hypothetical protein [Actinomycetota bacterium]